MVGYVSFKNFSFLIIFKQIAQLWTCPYKHISIILWVFVTENILNSEHEISTAKSLCNMAPPALVSKCQLQKWWKMSVHLTLITTLQTTIFHRFCSYWLQLLLIFWDLAAIWNFMNTHWPVWGLLSLPLYSPQYFKGSYWYFCTAIILSGSMNSSEHGVSISIFKNPLEFRNFMNTHWMMFKSGFATALQLTIFVYLVHIYHSYWP